MKTKGEDKLNICRKENEFEKRKIPKIDPSVISNGKHKLPVKPAKPNKKLLRLVKYGVEDDKA